MQPEASNNQKWAQQIAKLYGLVVLLTLLAEIAGLTVTWFTNRQAFLDDLWLYTARPTLAMLVVYAASLRLMKRMPDESPFVMIVAGSMIVSIIVAVFPDLQGIHHLLAVNVLVSAFFFVKRIVTFSLTVNTALLLLMFLLLPEVRANTDPFELIMLATLMIVCYTLSRGILSRGHALMEELIRAERSSKTDALTGLYNHNAFQKRFQAACSEEGGQLALALIDIDNFKSVNDTFGHTAGDSVLRQVAALIGDELTTGDFAARYGGEEFAILFPGTGWKEALAQCERIRKRIAGLRFAELGDRRVTVSIGLQALRPGMDKDRFFKETDRCLYHAKHSGKNRICSVSGSLQYKPKPGR